MKVLRVQKTMLALVVLASIFATSCSLQPLQGDKDLLQIYDKYVTATDKLGESILETKAIEGRDLKVVRLKQLHEQHRKVLVDLQTEVAATNIGHDLAERKSLINSILRSELTFNEEYIVNYTHFLETKDVEILRRGSDITDRHEIERAKWYELYLAEL
ncbi:MAG: hypothetical protein KF836_08500 [Fimbriimonadaceae bacterium]|nr:hypothetical protein [Fimbriimonadaceae bacterium]